MNRRSFLAVLGVSCVPLAGVPLGSFRDVASIGLTYKGQLVVEPVVVDFMWDTPMKATFSFFEPNSWSARVDGAKLWRGNDLMLTREFLPIVIYSAITLEFEWRVSKTKLVASPGEVVTIAGF